MDDDQHTGEDERDDETESRPGRSGRVRIIGAEPVGQTLGGATPGAGETAYPGGAAPLHESQAAGDEGIFATSSEPAPGEAQPPPTELPHWTAAPTGEVPAVLARAGSEASPDDPWASLPEPTWREEHADWTANEETFEPAMLAEDESLRRGSLSDSGAGDRQPWEFELPLSGEVRPSPLGAIEGSDEDTVVVPAVRPLAEGPLFGDPVPAVAGSSERPEGDAPGPAEDAGPLAGQGWEEPAPRSRRGLGRRARGAALGDPGDELFAAPLAPGENPPEGPIEAGADPASTGPEGRGRRRLGAGAGRAVTEEPPPRGRVTRRPPPGRRLDSGGRPPEESSAPAGGLSREPHSDRNLPVAVASGVVIGVIALVFFDLGTVTALVISTVVVTLASIEAFAAFRKAGYHPATLLGIVGVFSVMVATYNKGEAAVPLLVVMVVAFTVLWHLIGVDRGAEPVRSTAATVLVFCWIGVFGSYAALLLDPTLFPNRHGIAFLLGAVITAVAYDVAALATGALLGSHPLSKASPNKTWEGLIGGAVAAVVAAVVIVHFIHPWTVPKAAALGVVVAVVSPLGDLCESLIKRQLGLKDMGRILPGHGGLLDRIDGMLFVLPATYYLVKAVHLG